MPTNHGVRPDDGQRIYNGRSEAIQPNVAPVHSKAMPAILTTEAECDAWLSAEPAEAMKLQRPAPDDALKIVATGEKEDPPPGSASREHTGPGAPELPL